MIKLQPIDEDPDEWFANYEGQYHGIDDPLGEDHCYPLFPPVGAIGITFSDGRYCWKIHKEGATQ